MTSLGYRHPQEKLDKISEASKRNHLKRFGITFNGETLTATGWAKRLGITHTTMSRRIRAWGVENALTIPAYPQAGARKVNKVVY